MNLSQHFCWIRRTSEIAFRQLKVVGFGLCLMVTSVAVAPVLLAQNSDDEAISELTNGSSLGAEIPKSNLSGKELSAAAFGVLTENCQGCHPGQTKPDVHDREQLLGDRGKKNPYITVGDLKSSSLWQQIKTNRMPLGGELSPKEKGIIKDWILNGAEFPVVERPDRVFVSELDVLLSIKKFLQDQKDRNKPFFRFISVHTVSNNSKVPQKKVRMAQAAVAKAVNSLSRESPQLVKLKAIDEAGLVFAIDLRELRWEEDLFSKWQKILSEYPYGLRPSGSQLRKEQAVYRELQSLALVDRVKYIRGDWFVANALKPPLYHELLEIPATLSDLESSEGFSQQSDFLNNRIVRGGMVKSGISAQSRVVDYHAAKRGVWISSDFRELPSDPEKGNILRFPLGPQFKDNPHNDFAFEHAGGEVIFVLRNGMHGYMLVDEKGGRIDKGPIDIVADLRKSFGEGAQSPEITNGVSCISCHVQGMIDFPDVVADSHGVSVAESLEKVEDIYLKDELEDELDEHRRRYLQKLEQVVGPFLQVEEDKGKPIESFVEPVTELVRLYNKELTVEQVAVELGLSNTALLKQMIGVDAGLSELGLLTLNKENGKVKRIHWEARARDDRESVFQRAARKFGFTPGF